MTGGFNFALKTSQAVIVVFLLSFLFFSGALLGYRIHEMRAELKLDDIDAKRSQLQDYIDFFKNNDKEKIFYDGHIIIYTDFKEPPVALI